MRFNNDGLTLKLLKDNNNDKEMTRDVKGHQGKKQRMLQMLKNKVKDVKE